MAARWCLQRGHHHREPPLLDDEPVEEELALGALDYLLLERALVDQLPRAKGRGEGEGRRVWAIS
eukprot:5557673-Prymnesium_polylepis.1